MKTARLNLCLFLFILFIQAPHKAIAADPTLPLTLLGFIACTVGCGLCTAKCLNDGHCDTRRKPSQETRYKVADDFTTKLLPVDESKAQNDESKAQNDESKAQNAESKAQNGESKAQDLEKTSKRSNQPTTANKVRSKVVHFPRLRLSDIAEEDSGQDLKNLNRPVAV